MMVAVVFEAFRTIYCNGCVYVRIVINMKSLQNVLLSTACKFNPMAPTKSQNYMMVAVVSVAIRTIYCNGCVYVRIVINMKSLQNVLLSKAFKTNPMAPTNLQIYMMVAVVFEAFRTLYCNGCVHLHIVRNMERIDTPHVTYFTEYRRVICGISFSTKITSSDLFAILTEKFMNHAFWLTVIKLVTGVNS
jgi:hypothetical protein